MRTRWCGGATAIRVCSRHHRASLMWMSSNGVNDCRAQNVGTASSNYASRVRRPASVRRCRSDRSEQVVSPACRVCRSGTNGPRQHSAAEAVGLGLRSAAHGAAPARSKKSSSAQTTLCTPEKSNRHPGRLGTVMGPNAKSAFWQPIGVVGAEDDLAGTSLRNKEAGRTPLRARGVSASSETVEHRRTVQTKARPGAPLVRTPDRELGDLPLPEVRSAGAGSVWMRVASASPRPWRAGYTPHVGFTGVGCLADDARSRSRQVRLATACGERHEPAPWVELPHVGQRGRLDVPVVADQDGGRTATGHARVTRRQDRPWSVRADHPHPGAATTAGPQGPAPRAQTTNRIWAALEQRPTVSRVACALSSKSAPPRASHFCSAAS